MTPIQASTSVVRDNTTLALQAALRGLTARQETIAENVANVETPGYLSKTITFEDSLRTAMDSGQPGSMDITEGTSMAPTRMNGNNVNLDVEVSSQIETNLRQQLAVRALNAKYAAIRTVLQVN
jgi:flagellar basal-body rod protein FlgB